MSRVLTFARIVTFTFGTAAAAVALPACSEDDAAGSAGSDGGGGGGTKITPLNPHTMALADYAYCVIEDGSVACWGWAGAILGQGTGPDDEVCMADPVPIDLGTTKKVVSVALDGTSI